ncbi:MAG: hypothetical protein M1608_11805 [Candidatus Omnitrophica bacterium]|nr:hypothetical protein [Candidatus Omnitrophota bacterium]
MDTVKGKDRASAFAGKSAGWSASLSRSDFSYAPMGGTMPSDNSIPIFQNFCIQRLLVISLFPRWLFRMWFFLGH